MNLFKLAALAAMLTFGAVQAQEADKEVKMKVVVASDSNDINWTSDGMGFDPAELAVGESRTVTGDSGETITFTRTDSGLQLDIDGETVKLPEIDAHGTHVSFVDDHQMHGDIDVEVFALEGGEQDGQVAATHAIRAHAPDGVTIISGASLDDSVKESIRSVLISAGHDEEVRFVDMSDAEKHVQVIKKRVEIVQ